MLIRMELSLPRDARYMSMMRAVARCILADFSVPQEVVSDVELAVTEACANAVRHAVGTAEYSVRFGVDAEGVVIEIIDVGPGFAVPAAAEQGALDPHGESGRGLYLIEALVDELEFVREGDDNRLRLIKRFGITLPEADERGLPADLQSEAAPPVS